ECQRTVRSENLRPKFFHFRLNVLPAAAAIYRLVPVHFHFFGLQNPGLKFTANVHPLGGRSSGRTASSSNTNPPALSRIPAPTLRSSVVFMAPPDVGRSNAPASANASASIGSAFDPDTRPNGPTSGTRSSMFVTMNLDVVSTSFGS